MNLAYGAVSDAVADRLRLKILSGELKQGDWIRQDIVAGEMEVSIIPVREALRRLQAEGLVVLYPRRGVRVATLDVSEFQELYTLREELSILACRWVSEDFSRIPLDTLRDILDRLELEFKDGDILTRLQLMREFFFTIFEATGKRHLIRLLASVWDASIPYRRYLSETAPELNPERVEHYWDMYRACESRDPGQLTAAVRTLFSFIRDTFGPYVRKMSSITPE